MSPDNSDGSAHGSQEPPQSTPVSVPFMIPSLQVGVTSSSFSQATMRRLAIIKKLRNLICLYI